MVTKYADRGEPRWLDIADYLNEVGKAHNGFLKVRMGADVPVRSGKYLYVAVEFWPKGRPVTQGFRTQVHEQWPHTDYRSMTALLLKLILELDFKLTQEMTEVLTQAHF
jgi:hypothetical protein